MFGKIKFFKETPHLTVQIISIWTVYPFAFSALYKVQKDDYKLFTNKNPEPKSDIDYRERIDFYL